MDRINLDEPEPTQMEPSGALDARSGDTGPDGPPRDEVPMRGSGSGGRGHGRPTDDARRRRGGPERRQAGFGDGIERAFCARFRAAPPPDFPVQHRAGPATLSVAVVARRDAAWLLCDSSHAGDHLWPDHEPVADAERIADDPSS